MYKFREIREERNLTQIKVAEDLGCTKGFISRIENGSKYPTFPFAVTLAKYYGVSLDDFVADDLWMDCLAEKNL